MARSIVFKTPGHIDLAAFTMFGVNDKPQTTSPIGYFGTGLKYAVAVLIREKQEIVLWIGNDKYTFYALEMTFRTKGFTGIRMKREHWSTRLREFTGLKTSLLPFTTELGKNWELWQAYRELETNTRDEKGVTYEAPSAPNDLDHYTDSTSVIVTGDRFAKEHDDKLKHFLDPALTLLDKGEILEVYNRSSQYIYYRGMRVMDLPDKMTSKYTYNIMEETTLTEDRTIAYQYVVVNHLVHHVMASDNHELVRSIVGAKEPLWESKLNWDYAYRQPDKTFMQVVHDLTSNHAHVNKSAYSYYGGYSAKKDPWEKCPRPWSILELFDRDRGSTYVYQDAQGNQITKAGLEIALALINKDIPMPLEAFLTAHPEIGSPSTLPTISPEETEFER